MLLMPFHPNITNIFAEPDYIPTDSIEWYNVDLIILPLVAIDRRGYRLGKGGGYYDTTLNAIRYLQGDRPKLCGIGYSCQIYSGNLPVAEFDVPLDYFVSEDGLISFK
jgi:5-formyltetrahydrofolate cyclo-ligase